MQKSDLFVPLGDGEEAPNGGDLPDADAVRAFCARGIEQSSQKFARNAFRQGVDLCTVRLERILRLLEERTASIPLPQGFFARESDRTAAYAACCRLLLLLDFEVTAFRADFTALCAVEKQVSDAKAKDALAEIDRARKSGRAVLEAVRDLRESVGPFLGKLYPSFCEQLARIADLEHEGTSCDPIAVRRLCAELTDAVTACLRSFKQHAPK